MPGARPSTPHVHAAFPQALTLPGGIASLIATVSVLSAKPTPDPTASRSRSPVDLHSKPSSTVLSAEVPQP